MGGRGAYSASGLSRKKRGGAIQPEQDGLAQAKSQLKSLEDGIKQNEAIIDRLSKECLEIYNSVSGADFDNPKWKKWRENNHEINRLKEENGNMSMKAGELRNKISPPETKPHLEWQDGDLVATTRYVTSSTYERFKKRRQRDFDRWFFGSEFLNSIDRKR